MTRMTSVFAIIAALAGSLYAEDVVSSFTVSAPPGARFMVDAVEYTTAASFLWPQGSKHVLKWVGTTSDTVQSSIFNGTRYTFTGWSESSGVLSPAADPVQVITAGASASSYVANATVEYRILLGLRSLPSSTDTLPQLQAPQSGAGSCGAPGDQTQTMFRVGVVYLNGTCYWSDASIWALAGTVNLNAFPFPGYVFDGWSSNIGPLDASLRQFALQRPITLSPRFSPGKRVRFITSPPNLSVLIDRTVTPTSSAIPCPSAQLQPPFTSVLSGQFPLCIGEFDFSDNSVHLLSAPATQQDGTGNVFIFDSWSIGGGQNTVYTAKNTNVSEIITANFVPGARVSFVTAPVILKLTVDGRDNWPSYNFVWAVGSKYTVTAPAEQFDARGRKYVFKGWSNGATATQDIVVDATAATSGGMRLTANYELLNRLMIGSTVQGLAAKVDGADCQTPCSVDRASGATARVSVPATVSMSAMSRYDFTVWQDGGPADRTITFNKDLQTVNANYRISNRLTVVSDPDGGADFAFDPLSPDGFYGADATVNVTAAAKAGYRFRRWDGDLSGTYRVGAVPMSAPRTIRAQLDRVPYIAPAGVKNSAGDTPAQGVAAGSIISIYGESLATRSEVGPASPLAQTIAGVVVLLGDRLLPMIYVSPEQINAQLPDDLAEGTYNLTIKNDGGLPDVTAQFTVVRNAPGLYSNTVNGKQYALAFHEDGSAINLDSPAKRNELITILGTGFGPYNRRVPEGFMTLASPVAALTDPAQIAAGSIQLQPSFSGAAAGFVGIASSKFRIAKDLPGAASIDLRITVNGQDSNTVLLPIE